MPRTTTVDCPGCPPLRALTFDSLGLIKVIEARGKGGGVPKVVERWGDPDASECLVAASLNDRKIDPLLAVARKNGAIEILNPLNGELSFSVSDVSNVGVRPEDNAIVGLHLFRKQRVELTSSSCTLLACTTKGHASIKTIDMVDTKVDSGAPKTWNVCASGNISFSEVDGSENYALFGGKGVEVNMWDFEKCTKIWTAKPPPPNSLGIFTPTWFTAATFLSKDDHRKIVAGTNNHQVRLYDVSAQRRPVISFDFRETPIKAVAEDTDGHTIYIGNGSGDLASVDIRTGKLLGCFLGKCSGSIRSIARHPELPVIASCGLDSYLRVWDIGTRRLLSSVFLKQHLTKVVFDTNFTEEEVKHYAADTAAPDAPSIDEVQIADETEKPPIKRKNSLSKENKEGKKKKKASKEKEGTKKLKSKKRSKSQGHDIADDDE
ncbi:WD repeat-containing protein 74-like [Hibiscus syriacus]|uniref:WD repeat-containing protein 74-like n=1 Tax=Hibiscus syriacus TaxID=106335 RepID=UPI0019208194|nr:WD repeat-containing protein 74-like [Hibiscus syriacus]